MNRITIYGHLTRDIEAASKGDVRYAKFTVASDRSAMGESTTDYFPIVCFGGMIDDFADLRKGAFAKIVGSIRLGTYNGRMTIDVVAVERLPKLTHPRR